MEENKKTALKGLADSFGKAGFYYFIVMVLGALVSLLVLSASVVPFSPYTFYAYTVIPKEVCPNQELSVTAVTEMTDTIFYTLDTITVEGKWTRISEGGEPNSTFGSTTLSTPTEPHPKREVDSPLLRTAPDSEGRYSLEATVTVEGRILGLFKRYQAVEVGDNKPDIRVIREGC